MKNLIALTGLAGSGKTTAADYLVKAHGFTRIKFADPLKSMLYTLGLVYEDIEGEGKELSSLAALWQVTAFCHANARR